MRKMEARRLLGCRVFVAATAFALVAAACGGGGDGGSGAGGPSIEMTSPQDGAAVSVPFTVEIDSSEELGAPETGKHHVHVYFDGNEDEYEVVEALSYEVPDLASGEHTITASLRNADHSEAGAEAEVTVTVEGSGGGEEDGGDRGYDYGD
jgi:hypothetical protein